jgi:hypothetical protein
MWHLSSESRAQSASAYLRVLLGWLRHAAELRAGKFLEIGVTGVGVVIDAVNLPPLLSATCSVILAVVVASVRWALRTVRRAHRDLGVGVDGPSD